MYLVLNLHGYCHFYVLCTYIFLYIFDIEKKN